MAVARGLATTLLRTSAVNGAMRALAGLRGHRLVLVYHRLGAAPAPGYGILPTVPVDLFRAQLQALRELAELVPLDELVASLGSRGRGLRPRPAVAITFDDDLRSHVEHALPVLRRLNIPATFFLSGRALYGLGAYWFQQLESLLIAYGSDRTATLLGVRAASGAGLMIACERDPDLQRRVTQAAGHVPQPDVLQRHECAALAAAGMTIGFHTVEHRALPGLDRVSLDREVTVGREALAEATGAAIRYFAYPHGKADVQTAIAVRGAGFTAAFTGAPRPVRGSDDRHLLGRWEPGAIGIDDFVVKLAVRLHRPAPVR